MSIEKKRIIDIETGQSVKNVDNLTESFVPLKRQIKELIAEMGQLEQGTEEYNQAALKLAELQQRQTEVMEAAKYSNKDFGAVMSNLSAVSMGVAGGINAMSAAMAMLGNDSQEMQKVLARIQMTMAIIQGMAAIDKAIKAVKGLANSFSSVGKAAAVAEKEIESIGGKKVVISADTSSAEASVEALSTEISAVGDKSVKIEADTSEASTKIEEVKAEIESIPDKKRVEIDGDGVSELGESLSEVTEKQGELAEGVAEASESIGEMGKVAAETGKATAGMAKGAATAATATTTLATGEKAATTAAGGLKTAVKGVGTAIKSIPVIGWILAAVAALGTLMSMISRMNKESAKNSATQVSLEQSMKRQAEYQDNIGTKVEKIRLNFEMQNRLLSSLKTNSRQYREILKQMGDEMGLDLENTKLSMEQLNKLQEAYIKLKEQQLKVEYSQNQLIEYRNKLQKLNNALTAAAGMDYRVREEYLKEFLGVEEDVAEGMASIIHRAIDNGYSVGEMMDAAGELAKKGWGESEIQAAGRYFNALNDNVNFYEDNLNDASEAAAKLNEDYNKLVDEMGVKRKGDTAKMKAELDKRLEMRKKYIESLRDLYIQDAEFDKDWNRWMDEKIKKEDELYSAELKEYRNMLKAKAITKEQYDEIERALEEKHNNEISAIRLEAARKLNENALKEEKDYIGKKMSKELLEERKKLYKELLNNNPFADSNYSIKASELELKSMNETNEALKRRLGYLKLVDDGSKLMADEIRDMEQKIYEQEKAIAEKEIDLDIEKYNRRKQEAEYYYNTVYQEIQKAQDKLQADNTLKGGGTPAYDTGYNQQLMLVQRLEEERAILQNEYAQRLVTEEEYLAKSVELERLYAEESVRLANMRKEKIVGTYQAVYNVINTMADQIGQVLQEEMSHYDESSKQYKKLAVAQGWISTLSGTLGAFMSGVNSGIPAPYNLILAAAMAATTFAAGVAQIANIQRGGKSNSMTAAASSAGWQEYDTTSYSQSAELLGNVADSKVVVLESDITYTQSKVQVRENNSQF